MTLLDELVIRARGGDLEAYGRVMRRTQVDDIRKVEAARVA